MKKNNNNAGFSLIEIILAVTIMAIAAAAAFIMMNTDWAKDTDRVAALNAMSIELETFYWDYGVYPHSWATALRYPQTGCDVTWHESLVGCLVEVTSLREWAKGYNEILNDIEEGKQNDAGNKFGFYYWATANGKYYKLCALAWKQDEAKKDVYLGLNGEEAEEGHRYICVMPSDAISTDVTNLAE